MGLNVYMAEKIGNKEHEVDLQGKGLFRPKDVPEIERIIQKITDILDSSNEIRVLVLETWFFVDFLIRRILAYACSLSRYDSERFDAIHVLLPNNFNECLDALRKLLNEQRKLPPAKPKRNYIYIDPGMSIFLINEHQDFLDKLNQIEIEYIKKKYPDSYENILGESHIYDVNSINTCFRDEFLLKCCTALDKDWFSKVKELNEVRNRAAHYYDENEICKKLKITGENKLEQVREYCKLILEQICGVNLRGIEYENRQTENVNAK